MPPVTIDVLRPKVDAINVRLNTATGVVTPEELQEMRDETNIKLLKLQYRAGVERLHTVLHTRMSLLRAKATRTDDEERMITELQKTSDALTRNFVTGETTGNEAVDVVANPVMGVARRAELAVRDNPAIATGLLGVLGISAVANWFRGRREEASEGAREARSSGGGFLKVALAAGLGFLGYHMFMNPSVASGGVAAAPGAAPAVAPAPAPGAAAELPPGLAPATNLFNVANAKNFKVAGTDVPVHFAAGGINVAGTTFKLIRVVTPAEKAANALMAAEIEDNELTLSLTGANWNASNKVDLAGTAQAKQPGGMLAPLAFAAGKMDIPQDKLLQIVQTLKTAPPAAGTTSTVAGNWKVQRA